MALSGTSIEVQERLKERIIKNKEIVRHDGRVIATAIAIEGNKVRLVFQDGGTDVILNANAANNLF